MQYTTTGFDHLKMIEASWARCRHQHHLVREGTRPILRLQSSEVAPRLELLMDRTSSGQGIFQQLSESVASSGHCLVVTDEQGILVRLDSKFTNQGDWNGIGLGSCWDECIAGTNGVSMALSEGRKVTVRGQDHFFSKLTHFACTAVPLLDAENKTIGVINISAIDRGNTTDYLFAQQLLESSADRIQRHLFECRFDGELIVSVSVPDNRNLFRSNELLAVNSDGVIIGATTRAHGLVGYTKPQELVGKSFSLLFGADPGLITERRGNLSTTQGSALNLSLHLSPERPQGYSSTQIHMPFKAEAIVPTHPQRRLALSLKDLSSDETMARPCDRANKFFHRAIPFLIEGASGVGKTALVNALHENVLLHNGQVVSVDCASLDNNDSDRHYFRKLIEQARAVDTLSNSELMPSTLVLDNIDELPLHAQAQLRDLLNGIEARCDTTNARVGSDLRVIATCCSPLIDTVQNGTFRKDLYYLLAGTIVQLPALTERRNSKALITSLATRLSQFDVEITPEAEQALFAYDWPGNVRQLRSVLSQALIEGNGQRISLIDLTSTPVLKAKAADNQQVAFPKNWGVSSKLYDEKQLIEDALSRRQWNVSRAARELGIGRATMHRKMKKLGIRRPSQTV